MKKVVGLGLGIVGLGLIYWIALGFFGTSKGPVASVASTVPVVAVAAREPDGNAVRQTAQGKVVGYAEADNTHVWLGIPYAEPPVGDLRWRQPQPVSVWDKTRLAVKPGSACLQLRADDAAPREGELIGAEDCLTLNVYAPRFAPNAIPHRRESLPVMVWLHGGGNVVGSADTIPFAYKLAGKQKVIVVALNYRLGLLGWFSHPTLNDQTTTNAEASGNFALLDIIHGLGWVQQNIAEFGGNPNNVTIFGNSSGAANVMGLLVSPLAGGLFHKAIVQSGFSNNPTVLMSRNFVDDPIRGFAKSSNEVLLMLLQQQKLATDRQSAIAYLTKMNTIEIRNFLRQQTPETLVRILSRDGRPVMGEHPYLIRDGLVISDHSLSDTVTKTSIYNAVPVIVGSTRDEYKLQLASDPQYVTKRIGKFAKIKAPKLYERMAKLQTAKWKYESVDNFATNVREAHKGPIFTYRFDWSDFERGFVVDLKELYGAAHTFDVPFVFNATSPEDAPFSFMFTKNNAVDREKLSNAMASYWAQFAYTGSPARGREDNLPYWGAWSTQRLDDKTMIFDAENQGGIRMTKESISLAGLKQLAQDSDEYFDKDADFCQMYADLFMIKYAPLQLITEDEYNSLNNGQCQPFPIGP